MTKISAQVVADSICNGHRITSMLGTFPRFILAEFNTHRMFSRNSASSRAIPFKKMVEIVKNDPFIPIAWQQDHTGMQGTEYLSEAVSGICIRDWLSARNEAIAKAEALHAEGVTKQLCNRLLEPFMWHTVLVTATEWENFFALRCPQYQDYGNTFRSWKDYVGYTMNDMRANRDVVDDLESYTVLQRLQYNKGQAEIHMMALAEAMWDARNESTPKELKPGEWHIPFGDQIDKQSLYSMIEADHGVYDPVISYKESKGDYSEQPLVDKYSIKIATARAARTSYTIVGEEGKPANYQKDIELHDKLLAFGHMSPFEHCAQAMNSEEYFRIYSKTGPLPDGYIESDLDYMRGWCHNFHGWKSYRSMIPGENRG